MLQLPIFFTISSPNSLVERFSSEGNFFCCRDGCCSVLISDCINCRTELRSCETSTRNKGCFSRNDCSSREKEPHMSLYSTTMLLTTYFDATHKSFSKPARSPF